jgi:hypothetical protein
VAGVACAVEELHRRRRRARWRVVGMNAMTASLLAQVLAQELPGRRVEQTHALAVPLYAYAPADPSWRRAVVGGFDLDAAVEVHGSLAVLVVAERLERQRPQRGALLGKHHGEASLSLRQSD